nr:hypothetical protein [uncultured Sphingomonas sp.]
MNCDLGFIVTRLGAVQGAFSCEPDISPDLSRLTRAMLPVVLLALMHRGLRSVDEFVNYLYDRGAMLYLEDVLEVLDEFRTRVRYPDGTYDGLWRGDAFHGFIPNISVSH